MMPKLDRSNYPGSYWPGNDCKYSGHRKNQRVCGLLLVAFAITSLSILPCAANKLNESFCLPYLQR